MSTCPSPPALRPVSPCSSAFPLLAWSGRHSARSLLKKYSIYRAVIINPLQLTKSCIVPFHFHFRSSKAWPSRQSWFPAPPQPQKARKAQKLSSSSSEDRNWTDRRENSYETAKQWRFTYNLTANWFIRVKNMLIARFQLELVIE